MPATAPSAGAKTLDVALRQRGQQVAGPLSQLSGKGDAAKLCGQLLQTAGELGKQASAVRQDTPDYANSAAALEVSGGRLRRAAGILAGWQLTVTGGGEVAAGEPAELQVRVQAGPVKLSAVSVSLAGAAQPAAPPFALAAGTDQDPPDFPSRWAALPNPRTSSPRPSSLPASNWLCRGGPYTIVPPCETSLTPAQPEDDGRTRVALLTVHNTRRQKPLAVQIGVAPPLGFAASTTGQNVELKPRAQLKLPLSITPRAEAVPGWYSTSVVVSWDGGSNTYDLPELYLKPEANLLKNGGFEQAEGATATAWSRYGTDGYSLDTADKRSGQQAIRASGKQAGAPRLRAELEQFEGMILQTSQLLYRAACRSCGAGCLAQSQRRFRKARRSRDEAMITAHDSLPMQVDSARWAPERYVRRYVCRDSIRDKPPCYSIGVRDPFEGSDTPVWLRFHKVTGRFAEIRSNLESSALSTRLVKSGGHIWIPLDVPVDADAERMVDEVVSQAEGVMRVAYRTMR